MYFQFLLFLCLVANSLVATDTKEKVPRFPKEKFAISKDQIMRDIPPPLSREGQRSFSRQPDFVVAPMFLIEDASTPPKPLVATRIPCRRGTSGDIPHLQKSEENDSESLTKKSAKYKPKETRDNDASEQENKCRGYNETTNEAKALAKMLSEDAAASVSVRRNSISSDEHRSLSKSARPGISTSQDGITSPAISMDEEDIAHGPEACEHRHGDDKESKHKFTWASIFKFKTQSAKHQAFRERKERYVQEFHKHPKGDPFTKTQMKLASFSQKNEQQLLSYLRESQAFKDEYAYFRHLLKPILWKLVKSLGDGSFSFLKHAMAREHAHQFHDEPFLELSKISSSDVAVRDQQRYIDFLEYSLLPLVKTLPISMRTFFQKMEESARSIFTSQTYNAREIATSNFFLYVLVPTWMDLRRDLISFSSEALETYEKKELLYLKFTTIPEPNSDDEHRLIEGVVNRMNADSIPLIRQTYNAPEEHEVNLAFHRLLQKTFYIGTQLNESEFRSFLAHFFVMLKQPEVETHRKLQKVKREFERALLD